MKTTGTTVTPEDRAPCSSTSSTRAVALAEELETLQKQESHLQSEIARHDAELVTANDALAKLPNDASAVVVFEAKTAVVNVEFNRNLLKEQLANLLSPSSSRDARPHRGEREGGRRGDRARGQDHPRPECSGRGDRAPPGATSRRNRRQLQGRSFGVPLAGRDPQGSTHRRRPSDTCEPKGRNSSTRTALDKSQAQKPSTPPWNSGAGAEMRSSSSAPWPDASRGDDEMKVSPRVDRLDGHPSRCADRRAARRHRQRASRQRRRRDV